MTRLSSLQKAERVLRFVFSLRNPRISGVLVDHGFGPEDLDEVWTLFRDAAPVSFAESIPEDTTQVEARERIRLWQRRWMPIIKASLSRHQPLVATILREYERDASEPVPWAIGFLAFHDRMRETRRGNAAKLARATEKLLAQRGVTAETIEQLRELTEVIKKGRFAGKAARARPATPDPTAGNEEAIGKLWDWYLEWGRVVRTQIHDGRVLRQAGFLSGNRRSKPARRTRGEVEDGP